MKSLTKSEITLEILKSFVYLEDFEISYASSPSGKPLDATSIPTDGDKQEALSLTRNSASCRHKIRGGPQESSSICEQGRGLRIQLLDDASRLPLLRPRHPRSTPMYYSGIYLFTGFANGASSKNVRYFYVGAPPTPDHAPNLPACTFNGLAVSLAIFHGIVEAMVKGYPV